AQKRPSVGSRLRVCPNLSIRWLITSSLAARARRAATRLPSCRGWLRIFVVGCGLPCDPPVGGHSCNGGWYHASIAGSVPKAGRKCVGAKNGKGLKRRKFFGFPPEGGLKRAVPVLRATHGGF